MKAQDAFVALNLLPLIGPVRVRQMLSFFGDHPAAILKAPRTQLARVQGIGPELSKTVAKWDSLADLPAELQRVSDFGAHIVTRHDVMLPAFATNHKRLWTKLNNGDPTPVCPV